MSRHLTLPLALVSALFSTACSSPPPRMLVETRVERIQVPGELLSCAPAPEAPQGRRDSDAALLIARLWAAGEDCRSKLAAVRALVATPEP